MGAELRTAREITVEQAQQTLADGEKAKNKAADAKLGPAETKARQQAVEESRKRALRISKKRPLKMDDQKMEDKRKENNRAEVERLKQQLAEAEKRIRLEELE